MLALMAEAGGWWTDLGRGRPPSETVGERVRQWRESLVPKMSQRDLARRLQELGVWAKPTHSAVAKLELGQRAIDVNELVALAHILKQDTTGSLAALLLSDEERARSDSVQRREAIRAARDRLGELQRQLAATTRAIEETRAQLADLTTGGSTNGKRKR